MSGRVRACLVFIIGEYTDYGSQMEWEIRAELCRTVVLESAGGVIACTWRCVDLDAVERWRSKAGIR